MDNVISLDEEGEKVVDDSNNSNTTTNNRPPPPAAFTTSTSPPTKSPALVEEEEKEQEQDGTDYDDGIVIGDTSEARRKKGKNQKVIEVVDSVKDDEPSTISKGSQEESKSNDLANNNNSPNEQENVSTSNVEEVNGNENDGKRNNGDIEKTENENAKEEEHVEEVDSTSTSENNVPDQQQQEKNGDHDDESIIKQLSDYSFIKEKLSLSVSDMANIVDAHVQDCERVISSTSLSFSHEDKRITWMISAYEIVAKLCRNLLEEVETQQEEDLLEEEKEDSDNLSVVRYHVALCLYSLGYSLCKEFGYNQSASTQQSIQYFQESLSLFSLVLQQDDDIKLAQAQTLFCLGHCFTYQNYAISISNSTEVCLKHLSFLKVSSSSSSSSSSAAFIGSNKGLNTKAMKCYDQAFFIRRTLRGNDHPIVADCLHAIGVLYFEIRNWSHAVGCFIESLRIRRVVSRTKDSKELSLSIADLQEWIGYCQRELGKYHSSVNYLNEALVLRTVHLGKSHPEVASLLFKIAIVHDDLGELEVSLEKYKDALSIFRDYEESCNLEIEQTLKCIGNVYRHFQKWNEALEYFLECLDMQYLRISAEIDWLKDPTQEDEEARALPVPMYHNRDNRPGGSNRILVFSTSISPDVSAYLLKQRKSEDIEKLVQYVELLDDIYNLLTKFSNRSKHDEMSRILYRKSKALIKLGRYQEAIASLSECKKVCWLWEPTGGKGLHLTVEIRLCGILARMGQHDEAIAGYRELLREYTTEDQGMADILFNLGNSLSTKGEHNESLSCHQKCARIRQELGVSELELANVNYCLGICYCSLGQYDTSLKLLTKSLEVFQKFLGNEHVHVANTLYNIGQVYQSSDDANLEKAMTHYEEALSIYRIAYSPDHIVLGHVIHSIGTIHDANVDYPKAMLCFTDALRVYKLYNNGEHLGVAILMNSMGILSACIRNQNELAMDYFEEALRIRQTVLGEKHPVVADTIHNIGGVYAKQNRLEEAMTLYQKALEIRREHYGCENLLLAKTMNNLGIVHARLNQLGEAMDYFKEVLKIRRIHLDPEDEEIATTLYNIGNVHSRNEEYDLAMVCYEECLRVRKLLFGDAHISVANMLHNMGVILVDKEKYDNAIVCFDEALKVKRLELGDDSLSYAYTLQKIGHVHKNKGENEQALACFDESLNVQRSKLGADHLNVARILLDIASVRYDSGLNQQAMECYEEALHIQENHLGEEHLEVAETFYLMGNVYDKQEEIQGSMICFGNAVRILKQIRPSDDKDRIKVTDALRKVISKHSKKFGTASAVWDTIVVTGDYWLGIEQILIDLLGLLQTYMMDPVTNLVKDKINNTVQRIDSLASQATVNIKGDTPSFNALYDGDLCTTSE